MMTDSILKEIYFNPSRSGSFGGIDKLFESAKRYDRTIKREDVKTWLNNQLIYSIHKPIRKKFKRNPVVAEYPLECFQADLIDMQEYKKFNDEFSYILTVIDVFSKKAFVECLRNKSSKCVTASMSKILMKNTPVKLMTDNGKEFNNKDFKKMVENLGVNHFFSKNNKIKCSVIERFNRTLKNRMFRFFSSSGSYKFIDVLDDIVKSYNNTYHRSIKLAPNDVNYGNTKTVFKNLYGFEDKRSMLKKLKKTTLKPGDSVRRVYELKYFDKGFYPNWTDQIFKVYKVIKGLNSPHLKVKDHTGKLVENRFYPQELQKTNQQIYRVEKIIKEKKVKGKKLFFVKWLNFPESENSWINSEDLLPIH